MFKKSVKIFFTMLFSCVLLFSFASLRIGAEEAGDNEIFNDPQTGVTDGQDPQDDVTEPQDNTEDTPDATDEYTTEEDHHDDNTDDTESSKPADDNNAGGSAEDNNNDDFQNNDTINAPRSDVARQNELYNEADQNYRGNNAVKMDKSVSEKNYSTDYTAGIVSWICVGTGVVVIIVMLVSTKITGRRASRRRV